MWHSKGQYVDDVVYTNSMESFWAYLKRTYKGTYHWWSFKHCRRYLDEIAGRFNLRNLPVLECMAAVVRGYEGRLLPDDVLVNRRS